MYPMMLAGQAPAAPGAKAPMWQIALAVLVLGFFVAFVTALDPQPIYRFEPGKTMPEIVPVPRTRAFVTAVLPYLWWLVLLPLVAVGARLADRLLPRWWGSLLVHAGAGTVLSAFHALLPPPLLLAGYLSGLSEWKLPSLERVVDQMPASFFLYLVIVGIIHALDYSTRYRQRSREAAELLLRASRLEAEVSEARLAALRSQLNPHFLFNTLNTVSALIGWRAADARRVVTALSDLLRLTLEGSERHLAPLQHELDWLRRYLDIQHIRFGDRLRSEIIAPPELLDALVPCLILQPLVENAIKHGLESRSSTVHVLIIAEQLDGMLRLSVRDDGPGLAEEPAVSGGVGLSNTRRRLSVLYGSRQSVTLRNIVSGGAESIVELPLEPTQRETLSGDLWVDEVRPHALTDGRDGA